MQIPDWAGGVSRGAETAPAVTTAGGDIEAAKSAIEQAAGAVDRMVERAEALEVTDDETNRRAVELAGEARRVFKAIEARRKEIVGPANEFVRAVNGFAKRFTEQLKAAENGLKRKVADYQHMLELERRRREAEERAARERLQKEMDEKAREAGVEPVKIPEPVTPEPLRVTRTEKGSAHIRKEWTFEVEDVAKLPREYLVPDMKKIRAAVKAGVRQIPGVRIYEKSITVLR